MDVGITWFSQMLVERNKVFVNFDIPRKLLNMQWQNSINAFISNLF